MLQTLEQATREAPLVLIGARTAQHVPTGTLDRLLAANRPPGRHRPRCSRRGPHARPGLAHPQSTRGAGMSTPTSVVDAQLQHLLDVVEREREKRCHGVIEAAEQQAARNCPAGLPRRADSCPPGPGGTSRTDPAAHRVGRGAGTNPPAPLAPAGRPGISGRGLATLAAGPAGALAAWRTQDNSGSANWSMQPHRC